jgi:hypothetical protein
MINLPGACPLCSLGLPHPAPSDLLEILSSDPLTTVRHTMEPVAAWAMGLSSHSDLLLMAIGSLTG